MGLLDDYSAQALAYDRTRGVSRPVIGPVVAVLSAAPGRRLLDIGGGTGNYAGALLGEGFEPLVVDQSNAMLAAARGKGLRVLEGDAASLKIEDATFDAATMISMLHHVDDAPAALREVQRVLVPDGVLAAVVFTREDMDSLWVLDLFPSSRTWMETTHRPLSDFLVELPGAERTELTLDDMRDASLAALSSRPDLMLDPAWRSQTSYFERMERDHPDELTRGLTQLAAEVGAGTAPSSAGTASLISWTKPG